MIFYFSPYKNVSPTIKLFDKKNQQINNILSTKKRGIEG
jgi:hypothetical protein